MSSRGFNAALAAIVVLGVALAVAVAASTGGDPFDMRSLNLVRDLLADDFFGLYSGTEGLGQGARWPYPPGYLPVVSASGAVADATGVSFERVVRVAPILATGLIALIVQDFLGRRGASRVTRLTAAGAISLGPSFVVVCGYHGQIDAVAILPAVLALHRWEYAPRARRALEAGLLVGLGAALKTVPILMLLALLPSAETWRERVTLTGAAVLLPVATFLPFALGGGLPSTETLSYRGVPGAGGLSLFVQPDLPQGFLGIRREGLSGLSASLADVGSLPVLAGLALVAAVGLTRRPPAPRMSVLLWLTVLALGVNFFFQYALWGLPFFVMAGYVRQAAAAQAVLLPAMLIFYLRPWERPVVGWAYTALMIGLWLVVCFLGAREAMRLLRTRSGLATRSTPGAPPSS